MMLIGLLVALASLYGLYSLYLVNNDIYYYRLVKSEDKDGNEIYLIERRRYFIWKQVVYWNTDFDYVLDEFKRYTQSRTIKLNRKVLKKGKSS